MIEDFWNHNCNIFHLMCSEENVGYGFTETDTKFYYSDEADICNQRCHFHTKNNSIKLVQEKPNKALYITRKLSLPIGVDIRLNDKVVDCKTGIDYIAQLPTNVKNHHIIVTLIREQNQVIV